MLRHLVEAEAAARAAADEARRALSLFLSLLSLSLLLSLLSLFPCYSPSRGGALGRTESSPARVEWLRLQCTARTLTRAPLTHTRRASRFECRASSSPLDAESRGLAWPLPHHLVCVEKFTFPSLTSPYLTLPCLRFLSATLSRRHARRAEDALLPSNTSA